MPKALITGALGGIGKTICSYFHDKGFEVIGIDRTNAGKKTPYKIIDYDLDKLGYADDSVCDFYQEVEDLFSGELDVLINNAAVQIVKSIEDVTYEDWQLTLNSNLLAPFWLTQHFEKSLRKNKGSIINIASIHAFLTKKKFTLYSTSKGALVTMTRALALDLAPDIRVNAIIPAAVDTPMLKDGFKNNKEAFSKLASCHPLNRIVTTEEIAKTALFLAGEEAGCITGSTINVDCGIGAVLHDPAQ